MAPPGVRLQKILSAAGISSRRTAETLIRQGRVTVNGRPVSELGTRADPARDEIRVDGRRVRPAQTRRYLVLNKPRGFVTTRSDPLGRPTVMDLLKDVREYVYPVGRLDYDSEGVLLLTNDGELAARLMHPRYGLERVYEVRVKGVPDRHALERLQRGVTIDRTRTAAADVRLLRSIEAGSGRHAVLSITLQEGRNRQVRRLCDAIGHPVVRLRRIRYGPIDQRAVTPGGYRDLTASEVARLRASVRMERPAAGRRPSAASRRQNHG